MSLGGKRVLGMGRKKFRGERLGRKKSVSCRRKKSQGEKESQVWGGRSPEGRRVRGKKSAQSRGEKECYYCRRKKTRR